jgi:hypothetical protein
MWNCRPPESAATAVDDRTDSADIQEGGLSLIIGAMRLPSAAMAGTAEVNLHLLRVREACGIRSREGSIVIHLVHSLLAT